MAVVGHADGGAVGGAAAGGYGGQTGGSAATSATTAKSAEEEEVEEEETATEAQEVETTTNEQHRSEGNFGVKRSTAGHVEEEYERPSVASRPSGGCCGGRATNEQGQSCGAQRSYNSCANNAPAPVAQPGCNPQQSACAPAPVAQPSCNPQQSACAPVPPPQPICTPQRTACAPPPPPPLPQSPCGSPVASGGGCSRPVQCVQRDPCARRKTKKQKQQ